MGGLLDKANQHQNVNQSVEDHTIYVIEGGDDGGVDKNILIAMQVAGVVTFLISIFLLVQVGWLYATALDYVIAISVMILGWILLNGSDFISSGLSNLKMILTASGFIGLFAATIVGTYFMNAGGGVTIASLELDGDGDKDAEIDLLFYGPRGMDFTVEVLVDGEVQYTEDGTIETDRARLSIPLDEFWNGNSMDMGENSLVTYEVKVTSDGREDIVNFDDMMNREADTGFVKVNEIYSTSGESKTYTGISVEMIIGMGEPDAFFDFSNNFFTGEAPMSIVSDWEVTLTVKKGSSVEYVYPKITADEGFASGYGDFWNNWVAIPGEAGAAHLDRDLFYAGDGCYTFEVKIENVLGDTYTTTDSMIEFFWESNEASSGPDAPDDEEASKC